MKRKLKALSLIEVLVASMILVIVIVSVMMMFNTYYRISIDNEAFFIAENEIRQVFEELNTYRGRDQVIYRITHDPDNPAAVYALGTPRTYTVEGANGIRHVFTISYSIVETSVLAYAPAYRVCRVIATISWTTGSSLTMETIVYA